MVVDPSDVPRGTLEGLRRSWKADALSGFLVFLIALPLCLGIALACGYPAIAGVFTAIIGGIVGSAISNSELTIKGPAAGLIVIAIGCVTEFGYTGGGDPAADLQAYRLALGVGVAAGVIQILFGVCRAGVLGEFFPSAAVHGLLASIGIIIIAKQLPIALGQSSAGEPLELLAEIPQFFANMNPYVGLIGLLGVAIMFAHSLVKHPGVKAVPAQLLVLIATVPLAMWFEFGRAHSYVFAGAEHRVGPEFLVNVPANLFSAITFPDFGGVLTADWAEVHRALLNHRQPRVAAQRQGGRADRSLAPQDQPRSRPAGRRRRQHAGRARRRTADDLGDRAQQGQHRQRRPDAVR